MAEEKAEREYSLKDTVEWATLVLEKGEVVEIYIPRSNLAIQVDAWCAFVVLSTFTQADTSLVAEVRFLGCIDGEVSKLLQEEVNGRNKRGLLHLCPSQPCTEVIGEPFTIHALHLRVFSLEKFEAPYMDSKLRARARQWLRREREEIEEEAPAGDREEPAPKKPAGPRSGVAKRATKPKVKKPAPKDVGREGKPMTAMMREKLRGRLEEVKKKAALSKTGQGEVEESSGEPVPTTPDSQAEDSDCVLELEPTSGAKLVARPPSLALALAEGGRAPTGGDVKAKKSKKLKKSKKEKDSRTEFRQQVEAIRDITSNDLRGQLLRRAVITEQLKNKDKKKKKSKSSSAKRLSPKEKRKEKKKDKKKRRKVRADGVIESCSLSSTDSSEDCEEMSDSSMEDLETPMRQRSRDRPGSVLKMLTQHVQEQLEQAATTELGSGQDSLTGGVKVLTYFALQIKPSFSNQMREMREMHHLANVMDALRRGEIAKVGDALAARFMAIHQSLLDQNWGTAKFMEIYPLEESSAASTSMVLATRKHTKLVAKMQGIPTGGGWFGQWRGRGKGGKGGWHPPGDAKGEGKDGKSKGKKGKGGKGRDGWNAANNEWKEKKDKPEDK